MDRQTRRFQTACGRSHEPDLHALLPSAVLIAVTISNKSNRMHDVKPHRMLLLADVTPRSLPVLADHSVPNPPQFKLGHYPASDLSRRASATRGARSSDCA